MPGKKAEEARTTSRPVCFVLMPFVSATPRKEESKYTSLGEDQLDTIFTLLTQILKKEGFLVKRSEGVGDILRDIVLHLDQAALVCADLTGLNPNVMYELGIRHGFTKKTILLTQDISELPFDLRSYHAIEYGWITDAERKQLRRDIRDTLERIRENADTKFGPVHTHIGTKHLAIREEEKRTTLRKLRCLGAELNHLWDAVKDVHTGLARVYPDAVTRDGEWWSIDTRKLDLHRQDPVWTAAREGWSPTYPSIDLFIATQYLPEEFDDYGDISAFTRMLGTLRLNMHSSDWSLADYFGVRELLDALTDDIGIIAVAVMNDQYGEDLSLQSRSLLRSYAESEASEAQAFEGTGAEREEKRSQAKAPRRSRKGLG